MTIEVKGATTGQDKYIVRENGIQKVMTKDEIEAKGGTIPEPIRQESEIHTRVMQGESYEKAVENVRGKEEAQKMGLDQQELTQPITGVNREEQLQKLADKYGMGLTSAAETIKKFHDNPNAPEFANLNQWTRRDFEHFAGARSYLDTTAQSIAWRKLNEANKENPNILKTIWVDGKQTDVLNLEEAAASGLTDPEILNLIGRSKSGGPVPTIIKANRDDPGTLYQGGFEGITKNQLNEILAKKREREEIDTLLKTKGMSRKDEVTKIEAGKKVVVVSSMEDRATIEYKATIERQANALKKLVNYEDTAITGTYDIAMYLRKNPGDTATLKDAGFDQPDIEKAKQLNAEKVTLTQFIDRYFDDNGWETDRTRLIRDYNAVSGKANQDKAYKELTKYDQRLKEARGAYEKQFGDVTAESFKTAAENIVPFYSTARYAGQMEIKDIVINVGIDVATVATILWGGRILGAVGKALRLSKVGALERTAVKAGKAGRVLNNVTKQYEGAFTKGTVIERGIEVPASTARLAELANRVDMARAASIKADNIFLKQLEAVKSVSKVELKSIESKSNIKGLKQSVENVGKAVKDVEKAWERVDKTKLNMQEGKFLSEGGPNIEISAKGKVSSPVNTTKMDFIGKDPREVQIKLREMGKNREYIKALKELQAKQAALERSLTKADSTLKPRYSLKPPPAEFKGYQMSWGDAKPKIKGSDDLFDGIDGYLKRSREIAEAQSKPKPWEYPRGGAKVAVKEKTKTVPLTEEKGKYKLTVKPKYEEAAKAAAKGKKTVPKVSKKKSVLPGVRVKTKTEYARTLSPSEAASVYGSERVETYTRYIGRTIDEILADSKIKISPAEWSQIRNNTWNQVSPELAVKTATKGAVSTRLKESVKERIREAVREQIKIRPALAPKGAIKPGIKITTRTPTPTPPKLPPKPPKPPKKPVPLVPLIRLKSGASDKEKREAIKASDAAVAYRRGALQGNAVWHTWGLFAGKWKRVIVRGKAPEGAKVAEGPGSAYQTIQALGKGKLPSGGFFEDTGAVDTRISTSGGKPRISFERDDASISKGRSPFPLTGRSKVRISPRTSGRLPRG